ncbi:MAG TPA: bifunctional hydroxymethylpyrimidine kinase/phosphomethylpyrimidine kinase [Acidimicrobiia bacterium]|nr:bifunctional hydroxymethylpyrimidine kinase/phosphomethylpyrimidine kinase [Acidimicrobiia bacterium]
MTPPVALTIAGSDSGGGAGIQADLKTFAALGVFGTSAITALTAQNSAAVAAVQTVDADFVLAQVDAVLADLPVAAVKTGLLATTETVGAVADRAAAGRLPNLVVDPVMVSSTGTRLLVPEAERAYRELLVPHARVVTPNCREAAALLGTPIESADDQRRAAEALAALGPEVVVVTGGDGRPGDEARDVVVGVDGLDELVCPRLDTPNTHGSGCSFAAAIAAGLARGCSPRAALEAAKTFVHAAIRAAATWQLGAGHGPLNHLLWEETP